MWKIKQQELENLVRIWNRTYEVYTPQRRYGEIMLLPYQQNTLDLSYINFSQPVKEFLIKTKETLFEWERVLDRIEIKEHEKSTRNRLLFGVRACDTNGIDFMDKFYLQEFCDDVYKENRERTVIVALNCTKAGEQCFCGSQQSGPLAHAGSDLVLTPVQDGYLIEAITSKGLQLVELQEESTKDGQRMPIREQELTPVLTLYAQTEIEKIRRNISFKTQIRTNRIKEALDNGYRHPVWDRYAAECIRCGGCTNVCPTCTCFNVVEEQNDDYSGKRLRCIDSCQCDSFTRNAGGHKPRSDAARVRYRIYDKLQYIEDRFGHKGCTGCGRCIDACPVDINIVKTINLLGEELQPKSEPVTEAETEAETETVIDGFEIHQHQDCEKVYVPQIAIINEIINETRNIKRFVVAFEDKTMQQSLERKGQFFEITVFGVGEIAISIPFSPTQKDRFDFCVKDVGKVTKALHGLKPGDRVGLRGPFGKGFPIDQMKGRDILVVGSGVGIAPVRTVLMQIAEERSQFGKVSVIGSALSYDALIYKQDFIEWNEKHDMQVMYALNKPTEVVQAHVGYINDLLPNLANDWANTTAILCASPRRIKEVAKDLLKLGMNGTDILTSLETHMRCGIGKCGHCKVGNKYMCVDGPVFNYEEMLQLPPEF